MPLGAQLLVLAVLVLAAWLITHVALLVRVLGVTAITTRQRWFALIPLVTPVLGWRFGKRGHVLLWGLWTTAYVALRVALAMR